MNRTYHVATSAPVTVLTDETGDILSVTVDLSPGFLFDGVNSDDVDFWVDDFAADDPTQDQAYMDTVLTALAAVTTLEGVDVEVDGTS